MLFLEYVMWETGYCYALFTKKRNKKRHSTSYFLFATYIFAPLNYLLRYRHSYWSTFMAKRDTADVFRIIRLLTEMDFTSIWRVRVIARTILLEIEERYMEVRKKKQFLLHGNYIQIIIQISSVYWTFLCFMFYST